jgi:hypothetical protein
MAKFRPEFSYCALFPLTLALSLGRNDAVERFAKGYAALSY